MPRFPSLIGCRADDQPGGRPWREMSRTPGSSYFTRGMARLAGRAGARRGCTPYTARLTRRSPAKPTAGPSGPHCHLPARLPHGSRGENKKVNRKKKAKETVSLWIFHFSPHIVIGGHLASQQPPPPLLPLYLSLSLNPFPGFYIVISFISVSSIAISYDASTSMIGAGDVNSRILPPVAIRY